MKKDKKDICRRRRERDRLRREKENDDEQQVRLVNMKLSLHKANNFCPLVGAENAIQIDMLP